MKKKPIQLADELKYVNRMKWGFEQSITEPKLLQKPGSTIYESIEIFNFGDYSFTHN